MHPCRGGHISRTAWALGMLSTFLMSCSMFRFLWCGSCHSLTHRSTQIRAWSELVCLPPACLLHVRAGVCPRVVTSAVLQHCVVVFFCTRSRCTAAFNFELFLLFLSQAPWPLGVSCRWFDSEVFDNADYFSSTEDMDLRRHEDLFWTT